MFKAIKKSYQGNWTFTQLLLWYSVYWIAWVLFKLIYRYKIIGMHHIPRHGPVLFVSNHQSFWDPLIVGVGARPRPFISLARKTLFSNRYFGWVIRTVRAIPVDQDSASDLTSMRTCLDILKKGDALLVYAEGSRTYTGHVNEFANGVAMLMKRGQPVIIPVAIEGAFDVWPRMSKRPKLWGKVWVEFGKPRMASDVLVGTIPESMERLRQEVSQMRQKLRRDMKLPDLPPLPEQPPVENLQTQTES
jgi:1-acyl-sn-glycerol-3-phosphate acyltransferase